MASRFVIDASAWAKLFMEEPHAAAFRAWRNDRMLAGDRLLSPSLLPYELGQLLRREFPPAKREPLLLRVLFSAELDLPTWGSVFTHADRLTFYDAAYLSLAATQGATLVSYDDKLLKAAKAIQCKVLSPGA